MWQNFSRKLGERKPWFALVLPLWVFVAFSLAQVAVGAVVAGLATAGVPFESVNEAFFNSVLPAIIYVLAIALVIGVPWLIFKNRTTRADLGLTRLPSWLDLLLTPAGFIVYLILSGLLLTAASTWLTFVDLDQVQETGFSGLSQQFEYFLAFATLVIVAPVAEEILFRGYLFGKLQKHVPVWIAILLTSGLFALVHGAWNVGIDVFALSIVLCLLRIVSKSLWPSILLHMVKNGVAFYVLFINPTVLGTLG
jgi:uncharacterized protein